MLQSQLSQANSADKDTTPAPLPSRKTIACYNCNAAHHWRDCAEECKGKCPRNAPSHVPKNCPARTNTQTKTNVKPPILYLDSAASDTFINSDQPLTSHRATQQPTTVTLPSGSQENISTDANFKGYKFLYAPNFKTSLFSVPQFCNNKDKIFIFTSSKAFGINLTTNTSP